MTPSSVTHIAPSQEALNAILDPYTTVVRYAQLVRPDGTEYASVDSSGLLGGSVSVDYSREERRAFDLELDNTERQYRHQQGELWYDKIIRLWRGVQYVNSFGVTTEWTTQIGEFMIDSITSRHFPHTVHIQGRDMTMRLINSEFKVPTSFAINTPVEDLVKTIAISGGHTKNLIPATGKTTGKAWYFDSGTTRWDAIKQIATNYGYEVFMDGTGYLVMRPFEDPLTAATRLIFSTGPGGDIVNTGYGFVNTDPGNLVSYEKTSKGARLYNSIVVTGQSATSMPIVAFAVNSNPASPTSIQNIGERVYRYTSAFITNVVQAQNVANNLLAVKSLEEWQISLGSIVFPWLDGGDIIFFADPDPDVGQPSRFLLSSFTIPLGLGPMDSLGKRVTNVGGGPPSLPSAPQNLVVEVGSEPAGSISASWNPPTVLGVPAMLGYAYEVRNAYSNTLVHTDLTVDTEFVYSPLALGVPVYVRVYAFSANGNGPAVTSGNVTPSKPIRITSTGDTRITSTGDVRVVT